MKMTKRLFFAWALMLIPILAHADNAAVPHYVNFQSVLHDDGGNLITDPTIDVEFKILDQDGKTLYQELQPGVQVLRSSVNLLIGEGVDPNSPSTPTGGLPTQALDPTNGGKFLQIKIGNNQPSDSMEFGMVPYAAWAEKALSVAPNSIGSEEIKDGSIKLQDLEPGLSFSNLQGQLADNQLPTSVATDAELTAHISAKAAHPGSSITLVGPFTFSAASDVQSVLKDFDHNLLQEVTDRQLMKKDLQGKIDGVNVAIATEVTNRTSGDASLQNNLNTEISNRTSADTALQGQLAQETTNRMGADSGLQASINKEIGDRQVGDAAVQANINSVSATVGGLQTQVTSNTSNITILQNSSSTSQTQISGKVDKSGDSMSGDLDMQNHNINNVGTVDGVNVSSLNTTVANHEGRITALEGNSVPFTNVTGKIADTQVPQFMRPFAFGRIDVYGNILPGSYNIESAAQVFHTIKFKNPAPTPDYVIFATADAGWGANCPLMVIGQSSDSFDIYLNETLGCVINSVHVIVFGNF